MRALADVEVFGAWKWVCFGVRRRDVHSARWFLCSEIVFGCLWTISGRSFSLGLVSNGGLVDVSSCVFSHALSVSTLGAGLPSPISFIPLGYYGKSKRTRTSS